MQATFSQAISPQASTASMATLAAGPIVVPQPRPCTDVVIWSHRTISTAASVSHDCLGDA